MQSFHVSIIPNRRGESLCVFSFKNDLKNTAQKSLVRGGKKVMQKVVWCRRDKF